ncbi:MAG: DNA-processing protein DprA [Alphaproteobacteria bacterium]|nr:DNA-processing protein DprA [Alphaproteobacteria bacterium]
MQKEQNLINCLRLSMSENVGPATFKRLVSFFGSAEEALKNINDFAQMGGRKTKVQIAPIAKAEAQLKQAEKVEASILTIQDKAYPSLLKHISDPPPILFTLGKQEILNKEILALVGTRNASLNGKNFAQFLAQELATQGYVIASGMARGIDKAAHIGALQAPEGTTVAVLGTSVDTVYPEENKDIYAQIKEKGCIISEFPFGTQLNPVNFPRRNRIISGLSQGVIVVEANLKSGSLITAKEALSQGREVFAVPGSPLDPRSAGPNMLIQDGATLVTKALDVIEALKKQTTFHLKDTLNATDYKLDMKQIQNNLEKAYDIVMENLGPEMIEIDTLIRATGLDSQMVNVVLTQLELAGRLEHFTGNRVALIYGVEK